MSEQMKPKLSRHLVYLVFLISSQLLVSTSAATTADADASDATREERIGEGGSLHWQKKRSVSRATDVEVQLLLSQVSHDLLPWREGVSLEMVERLYCNPENKATARIQIIDGQPYVVGPNAAYESRLPAMLRQVMDLAAAFHIPDVDFVMSMDDHCQGSSAEPLSSRGNSSHCTRNAPLFSFCKSDQDTACVAMPDFTFESWPEAHMSSWSSTRGWMLSAAAHKSFSQRQSTLFWRGAFTSHQRRIMNTSEIFQASNSTDVHIMTWGEKEQWVTLPEHCGYQQLLHLAGNAFSTRLKSIMLCGSPVIYPYSQEHEEKEFWYHMLSDRHNIMLPPVVTDDNKGVKVIELSEELFANTRLTQQIGLYGQHLAAEVLHPDNIQKYWMELLTQYSQLLTFKPSVHADATLLEIAVMQPGKTISTNERTCNVC